MQFKSPLLRGRLVKRYKRFLADVVLDDGREITATCPNTGSMMGLSQPGLAVWLSESASPTRKYAHTWELVELGDGTSRSFVGINTSHPNAIVAEAVTEGLIAPLTGYASMRREVKYGQSSRIDLLLEDPAKGLAYVEIKNVHLLRETGLAEFPDSKTERGVKHLAELTEMVRAGHRCRDDLPDPARRRCPLPAGPRYRPQVRRRALGRPNRRRRSLCHHMPADPRSDHGRSCSPRHRMNFV